MQETGDIVKWLRDSITSPVPVIHTTDELLRWLTMHCSLLLQHDFPALVQLLYRVDVSENKLKYLLKTSRGEDAGGIMAALILERVEQIVLSRKKYRMPGEDIPDADKW